MYLADSARLPTASAGPRSCEAFALEVAEELLARADQAARGRLQLGDRRRAARAAGAPAADDARRRGARRRPARRGAGRRRHAPRAGRRARHAGHRRDRRLRAARSPRPTRSSRSSRSRAATWRRGSRAGRSTSALVDDGARLLRAAARRRRGHGDPRLHALSARPARSSSACSGPTSRSSPRARRSPARSSTCSARAGLDRPDARARATTASSARATPRRSARRARASCSCRSAPVERVRLGAARRRGRVAARRDARAQRRPRRRRSCGRPPIEPGFVPPATGSALIACGGTRVICTASVQESVPRWMAGQGRGWVTAEYGMLPASTGERKPRDVSKGRPDGRTVEIQRLIGRSLRGVVDFAGARRAHRSTSTATSSPPTAARAARRSPAASSRSRSPAAGCVDEGKLAAVAAHRDGRRGVLRHRRRHRRCSTSTTARTPAPRSTRTW